MGITELRRLCQLEEENLRLKRLVADLSLDKEMLQEVYQNGAEARGHRLTVGGLPYRVTSACRLMLQSHTVYNYRSCRADQAITLRIREIAKTRIRYGVQRIHILLRREE